MVKNLIALACCLLCLFTAAEAKVYKVSNPDEFKKAVAVAVPGDEIVIVDGHYSGWELTVPTMGTVGKAIVIKAETAGKVVFSGDVNKPVFQLTGSFTEISGLAFEGCNLFKVPGGTGILIELKATKYCRITDCTFSKNTAKNQFMPIVVISGKAEHNRVDHCNFIGNIDNQELQVKIVSESVPLYTLIDHNVFKDKDKVSWKVFNGGECVQIGQDPVLLGTKTAGSIVRDNRFVRCNGEAEVISNKSSGNSYINNYFEDCVGELVMRGGHDCLIDSNIIKGGTGGIRVNGTHHTITNNTFSGLPVAIRLMYGMAKGKTEIGFYIAASDCLIKNNRIGNTTTGILIGDSKNADWTGKFDTARYPSPTIQSVAPFDNLLVDNVIRDTKVPVKHNEN
ncbi:MAG: chondroitinase-B domain-containing protein [Candidatus Pedobacter colombiensis]|uniref:Chondroitinase-B domain-containing protein n=1 Tax=Candidatus Pedobacter colombiensis TaxID=3121371 RepID=A0AAJ6B4K9_9SPHI|nr:chondroitinase-B domain-containing protein [Pedobacter sp.]WEK17747.1 MAG: chondroitinase-B domain-containing protein [Pedobacter sp.]